MDGAFRQLTVSAATAEGVVRPAHAEDLCAGHFPGDPLVPGASLARLMAAVAGELVGGAGAEPGVLIRCTFHLRVTPADDILVSARLGERTASGADVAAEVRVRGRCAARARFRFGTAT